MCCFSQTNFESCLVFYVVNICVFQTRMGLGRPHEPDATRQVGKRLRSLGRHPRSDDVRSQRFKRYIFTIQLKNDYGKNYCLVIVYCHHQHHVL